MSSTGGEMESWVARDVFSKYEPVPEAGCWIFTGPWNACGYGTITKKKGVKSEGAHRAFFRRFNGPIAAGLCVCHKCDTPACVNPDHLFLGTQSENMLDRKRKGRYRGEWNGRSRLKEHQVIEALTDISVGSIELGRKFGVAREAIQAIRRGDAWAHLRADSIPRYKWNLYTGSYEQKELP